MQRCFDFSSADKTIYRYDALLPLLFDIYRREEDIRMQFLLIDIMNALLNTLTDTQKNHFLYNTILPHCHNQAHPKFAIALLILVKERTKTLVHEQALAESTSIEQDCIGIITRYI